MDMVRALAARPKRFQPLERAQEFVSRSQRRLRLSRSPRARWSGGVGPAAGSRSP
jgi:hypothetical protein